MVREVGICSTASFNLSAAQRKVRFSLVRRGLLASSESALRTRLAGTSESHNRTSDFIWGRRRLSAPTDVQRFLIISLSGNSHSQALERARIRPSRPFHSPGNALYARNNTRVISANLCVLFVV